LKKDYSVLLSKWLYYALIAIFLGILIVFDFYAVSLGNDMALRFLPTLLGLAFTFSILVVFFDLRDELEWKAVKKAVYSEIEIEISSLFGELLRLTENEIDEVGFKSALLYAQDSKIRKKMIFSKISELQRKESFQIMPSAISIFRTDKEMLASFSSIKKNLGDVQIRYGRHLNSKITERLIRLQDSLELMNMSYKLDLTWNRLQSQLPVFKELIHKLMPELHDQDLSTIDLTQKSLSTCIKSLVQEIYELWKMGIEFDLV
jgi:hypothetical protein